MSGEYAEFEAPQGVEDASLYASFGEDDPDINSIAEELGAPPVEERDDEDDESVDEDFDDDDFDEDFDDDDFDGDADDDSEDEEEDTEEDDDESEDEEDSDDDDEEKPAPTEKTRREIAALQAQSDGAAKLLGEKGLDYNALCTEYEENGELSEATLAALDKAGFPRDLVSGYIQGQQARYEKSYARHIKSAAGGEKAYGELLEWAAKHLTPTERNRYDKVIDSNDIDMALTAVENLINRRAKNSAPELVRAKAAKQAPSARGFKTMEAMAAAIDDPRYEIDEEYTQRVNRRLLASDL